MWANRSRKDRVHHTDVRWKCICKNSNESVDAPELELEFRKFGGTILEDFQRTSQVRHLSLSDRKLLTARILLARDFSSDVSSPKPASAAPPNEACFLLDLLLAKVDREVIPADLEEEFATSILPKYGARRARYWFWTQTVRTIATRNPLCRWLSVGGLVRLGEWIFCKISS
jgi:hypothetical protein